MENEVEQLIKDQRDGFDSQKVADDEDEDADREMGRGKREKKSKRMEDDEDEKDKNTTDNGEKQIQPPIKVKRPNIIEKQKSMNVLALLDSKSAPQVGP